MKSNQTQHSQVLQWISSTASAVAQLLIAGLIGVIWFVLMGKLAWEAMVSASLVALSVVVAVTWQQSRADARKRFLAALDAYADREITQSPGRKPSTNGLRDQPMPAHAGTWREEQ